MSSPVPPGASPISPVATWGAWRVGWPSAVDPSHLDPAMAERARPVARVVPRTCPGVYRCPMTRPHMTGLQAAYLDAALALGAVPVDPAHLDEVEDLARAGVVLLDDQRRVLPVRRETRAA